ncbi:MAG: tRNA uridine-5-carboxymethylaminomethyl(34) synthesis GTPase MnmE, partial [Candidatus Babeliales bacterium]
MLTHDQDAIIAQCTPVGTGALALIRLSGENAFTIADALAQLPSKKQLSRSASHTIHYGWVVDNQKNHIDQVLFLVMKAP